MLIGSILPLVGDPRLVIRDKDKFDLLLASIKFSFK